MEFGLKRAILGARDDMGRVQDGRLPGKLGLVQDLAGIWSTPRIGRDSIFWLPQACIGTFAAWKRYRLEQLKTDNHGGEDLEKILVERGFGSVSVQVFMPLLRGLPTPDLRHESVVNPAIGIPYESEIRWWDFAPGRSFGLVCSSKDETKWHFLDRAFLKPADQQAFVDHLRDLMWGSTGEDRTLLMTQHHEELDLWAGGRIHEQSFVVRPMADPVDFVSGEDEIMNADAAARRCSEYLNRGFSRTLMFLGPPGTGKSSLARRMARGIRRGRTLVCDGAGLASGSHGFAEFVEILGPDVVILDDFDHGPNDSPFYLMSAMDRLKKQRSPMVLVFTMNRTRSVDPALLRPGRMDEVRVFKLPTADHRRQIAGYYAKKFSIGLTDARMDDLVKATEGFSPAELREICTTMAALGIEEGLQRVVDVRSNQRRYSEEAITAYDERTIAGIPKHFSNEPTPAPLSVHGLGP